ncbi:uncharacterized protein J7T54_006276 [Emericellopsis cladophorae]|uniref:Uncharacterized protein n=1 Tax=Emericellopsis cladophorae TaxID=2686198 RepID=A0A9P9Y9D2_9HYPO|nr:uncharacterized protein J7T54_006276 [Emericellopsis cladophorae]KAI6785937.1 hypothetical protein J7T54_006276 [Emericellopsis cladophorae]
MDTWCVQPMLYGKKPEGQPASNPKASAATASFVAGGLIFIMHHHHYTNDIMGWAGEMHQLANNCASIWKSSEDIPEPPFPLGPRPAWIYPGSPSLTLRRSSVSTDLCRPYATLTTRLLKKLTSSEDGNWIFSYDAYMGYIWRVLSKHRARLSKLDLKQNLLWVEAVDMRRRFHEPRVPARIQGNVVWVVLTVSYHGYPRYRCIRQLTNDATQDAVSARLAAIAPIRDNTTLLHRTDSLPPMSNITTGWRDTAPGDADFGFATPCAFHSPFNTATAGFTIVYQARKNGPAGDDKGNKLSIGFEKELAKDPIEDAEWNKFFEFRDMQH